jgi:molybdopterin-guanine dinucleotide biosynthesis protein A
MLGVVLCGGKSARMGSDKGLLKNLVPLKERGRAAREDCTWAQMAVDKIAELKVPVVLSLNVQQVTDYSAIFSPQQLITDNETLKMHGPLCGVLSVHIRYPQEDLIILGCDLLLMETDMLKELLSQYNQFPAPDAFVYSNDGEPEPLCSIYKAKGLAYTLGLYHSQQLPKHSMKYMLYHIAAHFIPVSEEKKKCFRNFNAHAELNGL